MSGHPEPGDDQGHAQHTEGVEAGATLTEDLIHGQACFRPRFSGAAPAAAVAVHEQNQRHAHYEQYFSLQGRNGFKVSRGCLT